MPTQAAQHLPQAVGNRGGQEQWLPWGPRLHRLFSTGEHLGCSQRRALKQNSMAGLTGPVH